MAVVVALSVRGGDPDPQLVIPLGQQFGGLRGGQQAGDAQVVLGVARTAPAAGATAARHGWLGSHQRDASTPGGLILMGVSPLRARVGRFSASTPSKAAGPTRTSTGDPVNKSDIDGRNCSRFCRKSWWLGSTWRNSVMARLAVGIRISAIAGVAAWRHFAVA
jgi:hypothetical protein